jgi:succinate dehydrogenase (ubiquinone) membrane anchor subunit
LFNPLSSFRRFAVCAGRKFSNTPDVVNADSSMAMNKFYHKSMIALAVLTPVSFALSPSMLNKPIDLALGVLFPLHSHIGLNYVISDYVPKALRSTARIGLAGVTAITTLGLLQLNIGGVGMTETIKTLWRRPKRD